jgi:hypothetical protein
MKTKNKYIAYYAYNNLTAAAGTIIVTRKFLNMELPRSKLHPKGDISNRHFPTGICVWGVP